MGEPMDDATRAAIADAYAKTAEGMLDLLPRFDRPPTLEPMTATENAAHTAATGRAFNADATRSFSPFNNVMDATYKAMTAYLAAGSPTLRYNPKAQRWGMVRRG